ncbi:Start control protein cdc10 [Elsinoe australis]|uniref:Start control protein cdc10 n=1 Tax=Elsinoe australis TaxID=40998 RepID=A0A2P7Z2Z2_9PEZI|nr:Start control protein cdc10 [Elsinoe australis]
MAPPRNSQAAAQDSTGGYKRREFNDLHPKDQQIKQTKKLCIEKNWGTPIDRCLPESIRPRIELKKGAKARVSDPDVDPEVWWNWSVELLKAIEELSSMTEGDLSYACQLLTVEVEERQLNPKSSQRKVSELLLGDVQKVVDEQRKRLAIGYHNDVMESAGESMRRQSYNQGDYYPDEGSRFVEGPPRKRARQAIDERHYDSSGTPSSNNDANYAVTRRSGYHEKGRTHMPRPGPPPKRGGAPTGSSVSAPGRTVAPASSSSATEPPAAPQDLSRQLRVTELNARSLDLRVQSMRMELEAAEEELAQLKAKASELRGQMDRAE